MTGCRFGRLTVLKRADDQISASGRKRAMWECKCDCGNTTVVSGDALRAGRTTSCGCYRHDYLVAKQTIHGETDSRLYAIWCAMKNRCNNPNVKAYPNYGGRGIKICDEWTNSFSSFSEWAYQNGYAEDLSIDRIDNNGNYEPDNCRWVTDAAQASNRRTNRLYTINGETHTLTQWAEIKGMNPKTLFNRVYAGWDFEEAINTPLLQ